MSHPRIFVYAVLKNMSVFGTKCPPHSLSFRWKMNHFSTPSFLSHLKEYLGPRIPLGAPLKSAVIIFKKLQVYLRIWENDKNHGLCRVFAGTYIGQLSKQRCFWVNWFTGQTFLHGARSGIHVFIFKKIFVWVALSGFVPVASFHVSVANHPKPLQ